ncbi:MAG: hypothetical protein ACOX9R_10355 [Armatimonadota bacterium]|jgi:hypothetical protein
MSWEDAGGQVVIELFPSALILTAAIIGVLLATRHLSLRVLEDAPDPGGNERFMRGARWGWLVALLSFVVVVVVMSALFGYAVWDFKATALAWLTALLPVAGSIGFLMMPEFMGNVVWAQAIWDELGGRSIDWPQYRAITARLQSGGARWAYYSAWVVGSVALTVGPLWTHALVNG